MRFHRDGLYPNQKFSEKVATTMAETDAFIFAALQQSGWCVCWLLESCGAVVCLERVLM